MSDTPEIEAARLAVLAAGAVNGDLRAWETRVAEMAPVIAAMLRVPSGDNINLATTPVVTARKVLDADAYRATFVSSSPEEKTHRLLVKVKPDHGKPKWLDADGCEEIRTEPGWTRAGFVMQRRIAKLEPGTPILVYKYVESIEGGEKQARCLVHFDILGRPRSGDQQAAPRQPASPPAEPAPQQDPAPAAAPPEHVSGGRAGLIAERREVLTPSQRVAWGRLCAQKYGVANFMDPSDEDLDKVLTAFGEIEKGTG